MDTHLPAAIVPTIKSVVIKIVPKTGDHINAEAGIENQIDPRLTMLAAIPMRGCVGRRPTIASAMCGGMRRRSTVKVIAGTKA